MPITTKYVGFNPTHGEVYWSSINDSDCPFGIFKPFLIKYLKHNYNMYYRHIVYQKRIFFIPKIIVVNDLFKLSLNSYAARDTICVLFFWQKRPKTIVIGIIVHDDNNSI